MTQPAARHPANFARERKSVLVLMDDDLESAIVSYRAGNQPYPGMRQGIRPLIANFNNLFKSGNLVNRLAFFVRRGMLITHLTIIQS
jgi:hypothetical protein